MFDAFEQLLYAFGILASLAMLVYLVCHFVLHLV